MDKSLKKGWLVAACVLSAIWSNGCNLSFLSRFRCFCCDNCCRYVTLTKVLFLPGDVAVMHRGTPLYGQPAWWGDGDTDEQQPGRPEEKSSDRKREKAESGIIYSVENLF